MNGGNSFLPTMTKILIWGGLAAIVVKALSPNRKCAACDTVLTIVSAFNAYCPTCASRYFTV